MKLNAFTAAVCTTTALSCVFAFTPIALADSSTPATDGSGSTAAPAPSEGDTAYVPQLTKGKTFTSGKAVYKITSINTTQTTSDGVDGHASVSYASTGTVELVSYKGGTKAKVADSVSAPKLSSTSSDGGDTYTETGKFSVTSIGKGAFDNAKGHKVKSVSIGKNVATIGEKAFYKCKKLIKITLKGDAIRTIGPNSDKKLNRKSKSYVKQLYKLRTKKWKNSHVFEGVPRHCEIKLPNINADKNLSYNINYANAIRLLAGHAKYVGLVK